MTTYAHVQYNIHMNEWVFWFIDDFYFVCIMQKQMTQGTACLWKYALALSITGGPEQF